MKIKILYISISILSFTAQAENRDYLPINSQWGYQLISFDKDDCAVYKAITKNNAIIIKPPIHRIGKFIFTTSPSPKECFKK